MFNYVGGIYTQGLQSKMVSYISNVTDAQDFAFFTWVHSNYIFWLIYTQLAQY